MGFFSSSISFFTLLIESCIRGISFFKNLWERLYVINPSAKPNAIVVKEPTSIDSSIKMEDTVDRNIPAEKAAMSPLSLLGYLKWSDINAPNIKEDATVNVMRSVKRVSWVRKDSTLESITSFL